MSIILYRSAPAHYNLDLRACIDAETTSIFTRDVSIDRSDLFSLFRASLRKIQSATRLTIMSIQVGDSRCRAWLRFRNRAMFPDSSY